MNRYIVKVIGYLWHSKVSNIQLEVKLINDYFEDSLLDFLNQSVYFKQINRNYKIRVAYVL